MLSLIGEEEKMMEKEENNIKLEFQDSNFLKTLFVLPSIKLLQTHVKPNHDLNFPAQTGT